MPPMGGGQLGVILLKQEACERPLDKLFGWKPLLYSESSPSDVALHDLSHAGVFAMVGKEQYMKGIVIKRSFA